MLTLSSLFEKKATYDEHKKYSPKGIRNFTYLKKSKFLNNGQLGSYLWIFLWHIFTADKHMVIHKVSINKNTWFIIRNFGTLIYPSWPPIFFVIHCHLKFEFDYLPPPPGYERLENAWLAPLYNLIKKAPNKSQNIYFWN